MKFTQIPADAFEKLQLNAGILVDTFNPASGEIGSLMGATSGGITFATNPTYTDFGEDVDNCKKNTMELKRLDGYDPSMSGTFLTVTAESIAALSGAADVDTSDATHVIPREELETKDFKDLWWIGDYSDKNTGDNAGFLAIHLMNALNTSGFGIKSSDKAKGQMAFEFHGHYSIAENDKAPFEIYCKAGANA